MSAAWSVSLPSGQTERAEEPAPKRGRRHGSKQASLDQRSNAESETGLKEADLPSSCRLYEAIAELGFSEQPQSVRRERDGMDAAPPVIQRYLFARPGPCMEVELERLGVEVPASLEVLPVVDNELDWSMLGDLFRPLFMDEEPPDSMGVLEQTDASVEQQAEPSFPIYQHYQNALLEEQTRIRQARFPTGKQSAALSDNVSEQTSQARRNAFASLLLSPKTSFDPIDFIALLESSSWAPQNAAGVSGPAAEGTIELGFLALEIAVPCLLQRWLRDQSRQPVDNTQNSEKRLLPDGLRDLARTAFQCARVRERFLFPDWVTWVREHLRLPTRAGLAGVWLEFELMRLY
ncbi:hypothetical protein CCYA_CCYA02G0680 [Cyanidiococcus yangmingshanensis]|nr:hypothetical protein CCYA_CCYA02G0680 [Cyanidiococcus yangmingshanensis]